MSIHVNDLIEKYVNLKEKGMDLSEIRNELKIQQIDDYSITEIIKRIDYSVQDRQDKKMQKSRAINFIVLGIIFVIFASLMTFGSRVGLLPIEMPETLQLSPFVVGIGLLVGGVRLIFN